MTKIIEATIHVASISGDSFTNHYLAASEAGLNSDITAFCRNWWADAFGSSLAPETDEEMIDVYFSSHNSDVLNTGQEVSFDLTTIPAVATLVARNVELEAFRQRVAEIKTLRDMYDADETEGYDDFDDFESHVDDDTLLERSANLSWCIEDARSLADTNPAAVTERTLSDFEAFAHEVASSTTIKEIMNGDGETAPEYFSWAASETLIENLERLDGFITKARALTRKSSQSPLQSWTDGLQTIISDLVEQLTNTSAWDDAERGEDDGLLAVVTNAKAMLGKLQAV